ncbi:MAG: RNA methyltransferase [Tissierellia bacterium]|nr:RNA methyltransferase [Tissierellia bacterium]
MKEISSRNNPEYKALVRLKKRKYRDREEAFLVEGPVVLEEALAAGVLPKALYYQKGKDFPGLRTLAQGRGIPWVALEEDLFLGLSDTVHPQGVLGLFPSPIKDFSRGPLRGKWLYSDGVQNPANLGGMIRSLEAFGFSGLLLGPGTVDVLNPKVVRGTMASIFRVPIYRIGDKELFGQIDQNVALYTLDLGSKIRPQDLGGQEDLILAVGNEAGGIRQDLNQRAKAIISIPMGGQVDSLNANVAASIAMYLLGGD